MYLAFKLPKPLAEVPLDLDALNLKAILKESISAAVFDFATGVTMTTIPTPSVSPASSSPSSAPALPIDDDGEDFSQPDAGPNIPHARLASTRLSNAQPHWTPCNERPCSTPASHPAIHLLNFNILKERAASTGWIGLRDEGIATAEKEAGVDPEASWRPSRVLEDFFGPQAKFRGFQLEKYLGPETRPIVDSTGRVIAIFAGHEDDPNFHQNVHNPAAAAMANALEKCSVSEEKTFHRRGNFTTLTTGQSHGGGQLQPGTLANGVINAAVLACLIGNAAFIRLTAVFANWALFVYKYYVIHMRQFYGRNPHLKRPFLNSIWSACTFNLGPQTCALGHRDFANLSFRMCAITALGDFDYRKGGHLILWDCRLILEFPPGCTILIPSAILYHSNIPVAAGEWRYSFTQYTAGGIFCWVRHGFTPADEYFSLLSKEEQVREKAAEMQCWENGVGLYSYDYELK
ncbi:hypothetical protein MSAN_00758900 [Mycena sanguinolenta]|uniref:Uncharacterized protein n=1 Tax=Mycena sanguinolenta TaxID=230812 RepID=A0A8H7DFJ9_9AGAR|nr:hypothetical protein MSAN_00758900 [Mycena sanguinolenta]